MEVVAVVREELQKDHSPSRSCETVETPIVEEEEASVRDVVDGDALLQDTGVAGLADTRSQKDS